MTRTPSLPIRSSTAIAVAIVLAFAAGRGSDRLLARQAATATPVMPVVRQALVTALPPEARGYELQLIRYEIPPGTMLPPHTHPGTQAAFIESGTLHYAVVRGGEVPVYRKGAKDRPGPVEMVRPGQEVELHAGDTAVEEERVVHFGGNRSEKPIVIWVAALLKQGAPAATVREAGE